MSNSSSNVEQIDIMDIDDGYCITVFVDHRDDEVLKIFGNRLKEYFRGSNLSAEEQNIANKNISSMELSQNRKDIFIRSFELIRINLRDFEYLCELSKELSLELSLLGQIDVPEVRVIHGKILTDVVGHKTETVIKALFRNSKEISILSDCL